MQITRYFLFLSLVIVFGIVGNFFVSGCTNIVVSPGASSDGSSIISYNADSAELYGALYHYPATDYLPGTMRKVYDWSSGNYLGEIPEVEHTYNVVQNVNEYGLIIGETTFGGLARLSSQPGAILDYGSLIWITLQRARNAREAISTINDLMTKYGYYSSGESFSIADQKEAWVMEIIGKGAYEKGAVWVAKKIPNGYICSHANQARITTFDLNDSENTLYASDVISFARKIGLYPMDKPDTEFSFSDIYDPVTVEGARSCEARVWSTYSKILGPDWSDQYVDYVLGKNLTNRMPLFIQAPQNKKFSVSDLMNYMRDHYENTILEMRGTLFSDVGAMIQSPFRSSPLIWTSKVNPSDGKTIDERSNIFTHERPIAVPETGWNFVAQSRPYMPRQFAALLWFGVDDSSTTVRFPIYGSARHAPVSFVGKDSQDGVTAPMMEFTTEKAFYVFNLVANWAYSRWDLIYPDILQAILKLEDSFMVEMKQLDQQVLSMIDHDGMDAAIDYATDITMKLGDGLTKTWYQFFGELFVKYRDGFVITSVPEDRSCGCNTEDQSYPQDWYDRIVRDTKEHYWLEPGRAKCMEKCNTNNDENDLHRPLPKSAVLKPKKKLPAKN